MEIEVSVLSKDDLDSFYALIRIYETVFEMEDLRLPGEAHLQGLLGKSDFLVVVAKDGPKVVGGLTVHVLDQYYSSRPLAYIYDVGVHEDYQRQGIGRQLITCLTSYCKENGFEAAFVQAEADDADAVAFYRATRGVELSAIHFTYEMD